MPLTMTNNNNNNSRRNAALNNATRSIFEPMEKRQMMSATSIKTIDSGGPDNEMIEAGGTVYVVSSHASGGGWSQIHATKGPKNTSKMLVDLRKAGEKIWDISGLISTADGRVFFTATGGTGSGRQLFQLNTSKGGYTQITKDAGAFYSQSIAIGNQIYLYDSTNEKLVTLDAQNKTKLVVESTVTRLYQAKGQLFFMAGNEGLWRTNGTSAGTYKVSGNLSVSVGDVFSSADWIYFEGSVNNNNSIYRSDGSNVAPTKIADDFSISINDSVELGDFVYFSGGYYSTSPNSAGRQLYRIQSSTGQVTAATNLTTSNGGGNVEGISLIGTHVYFTAGDGDYIQSQGTTDRELYRYNTADGTTKKITLGEQLYPLELGGGVLSSYYFVAAPSKADARFGSRRLYRTSPTDDAVEEVAGLPSYQDSNGVTRQLVENLLAGSSGLYYEARNTDQPGDYDTYFVPTPYAYIDPVSKVLTVTATDSADTMTVKAVGDEIVLNLNGLEERYELADFTSISIALKGGDDKLTTDKNVTKNMSVTGEGGNDVMTTGSGNDSILGGAGKNYFYGGAGNDRLRGSSGFDYMEGGAGNDRLYGRAGNDDLHGNDGVDAIYGDDATGPYGNDKLYGESSNDKIYGYGGDDKLYGGKQNDSLYGGDGKDSIFGQDGNDTLDGGAGIDLLAGDLGDDVFFSQDSALDLLDGGPGSDKFSSRDTTEGAIKLIEL